MAEKHYGGSVPVNMEPVMRHITVKIAEDRKKLGEMMASGSRSEREFEEQVRLLQEYQAGVRSLDILTGKVDHRGDTIGARAGVVTPLATRERDSLADVLKRAGPPLDQPDDEQPGGHPVDLDQLARDMGQSSEDSLARKARA